MAAAWAGHPVVGCKGETLDQGGGEPPGSARCSQEPAEASPQSARLRPRGAGVARSCRRRRGSAPAGSRDPAAGRALKPASQRREALAGEGQGSGIHRAGSSRSGQSVRERHETGRGSGISPQEQQVVPAAAQAAAQAGPGRPAQVARVAAPRLKPGLDFRAGRQRRQQGSQGTLEAASFGMDSSGTLEASQVAPRGVGAARRRYSQHRNPATRHSQPPPGAEQP